MATEPQDATLLHQVVTGAGVLMTSLVGWVFKHTTGRIEAIESRIEATMVTKDMFNTHTEHEHAILAEHIRVDEKAREQISSQLELGRQQRVDMFHIIDAMKQDSYKMHLDLLTAINTRNSRGRDTD